ncbi:helix-turn-helix transcriptional regulator [Mycobacterium bourgelatii]|nr:helix-turn-helix transcriptional regulator [Mycobacterium bourgelatii]
MSRSFTESSCTHTAASAPENIAGAVGFAPHRRITSASHGVSAAIWRFRGERVYELRGPAREGIDLVSLALSGKHHHTYFGNGRKKWSRPHPAFHMNLVAAGEHPRGIFRSERPFSYLHVYLPHRLVERVAAQSGVMKAAGSVTLTDPMCSRDPFVENIARQIVREMSYPDAYSAMTIDLLAQHLVVRLIREHSSLSGSITRTERSVAGYRDWRLKRLVEYLEAHVSDDVGLNDLAELVGLSAARVATLFREGTGEPPHRWLMNRRVTKACELLGNPSLSIGEIAQQCGFASPQHLATVMRRLLATTPTEFRAGKLGADIV